LPERRAVTSSLSAPAPGEMPEIRLGVSPRGGLALLRAQLGWWRRTAGAPLSLRRRPGDGFGHPGPPNCPASDASCRADTRRRDRPAVQAVPVPRRWSGRSIVSDWAGGPAPLGWCCSSWRDGQVGPVLVLGPALFVLVMGRSSTSSGSPRLQLVRSVEPPRVEKGQPAIAVVQATNRSWRALSVSADRAASWRDGLPGRAPEPGRAETSLRTYRLPTSQRGTYSVGTVEVPRADRSACAGGSRPWENRRSFRSIPECCR